MLLWFVIVFLLGVALGLFVDRINCDPPKAGYSSDGNVAEIKKKIISKDFIGMVAHGGDAVDMAAYYR